jgi:hypothetical protein
MQTINILGDQGMKPSSLFQFHQGHVSCIGFGSPGRMRQTFLPRQPADFRIGHVVTDIREFLGFWIQRPYAPGAAKIRDSRFGGDARAGKCGNASGASRNFSRSMKMGRHPKILQPERTCLKLAPQEAHEDLCNCPLGGVPGNLGRFFQCVPQFFPAVKTALQWPNALDTEFL